MIANIAMVSIIGFVMCWWIVQIVGSALAGRRIDDPFRLDEAESSQDK